jgi:DNA repair exonuclease SbcCD ATPase subunit
MKTNELELLNTIINHAYSAGYVCGLDENKTTNKANIERLESEILRLNDRCAWWQAKHKKAVENYENFIHRLQDRVERLDKQINILNGGEK